MSSRNLNGRQFRQPTLPGMTVRARRQPDPFRRVDPALVAAGEESYANRVGQRTDDWGGDELPDGLDFNEIVARRVAHDVEGQVSVRMHSPTLPSILESNRYYNQHHKNIEDSGGLYNPAHRAQYERRAFGFSDRSQPARHHPVYGYMHNDTDWGTADQYGDVRAVMKPEVDKRTTITAGDSLPRGVPLPLADVRRGVMPKAFVGSTYEPEGFTEAQIHGPLVVNRDVDHLEFHGGRLHGLSRQQWPETIEAKRIATEQRVPWRELKYESYAQQPLSNSDIDPVANWREHQAEQSKVWGASAPVYPLHSGQDIETERSPGFRSAYSGYKAARYGREKKR